ALLALGIIDFARAMRAKRVLRNAAHEAARLTASTPLTSRNCNEPMRYAPCSIQLAADAAKQSLAIAGFDKAACITPKTPSVSGVLVWIFSCDGGSSCDSQKDSVCMKIDMTALEVGSDKSLISATRITLQYPHTWILGSIPKLLPGRPTFGI